MSHDTITALIGVAAAALGATGKGVWGWMRGRVATTATVQTARIDDATEMRAELWREVNTLRHRMDQMQVELDASRRGYLELLAEHTSLKTEHKALKYDHEALLLRYAELERRVDNP